MESKSTSKKNNEQFFLKFVDIIIKYWYSDNSTDESGVKLCKKVAKKYKKVLDINSWDLIY